MKKNLNAIALFFSAALLLTACGGSDNSTNNASPAPVESKNTKQTEEVLPFDVANVIMPHQLKGKVEAIRAKKYVNPDGFPMMEITFKLIGTVKTSSLVGSTNQMWIIGIGQTEEGVDVAELLPSYREWRCNQDTDGSKFKSFLESEPDETITLVFSADKSDNVKEDLGKVKKFKLMITK